VPSQQPHVGFIVLLSCPSPGYRAPGNSDRYRVARSPTGRAAGCPFPAPDWVAHQKFGGNEDYRGGGHFSARLTAGIVAAAGIAKKLMKEVSIHAEVIEIGGEKDLEKGLQKAIDAKDSVGGILECKVYGLPVGLGEPWFDSVESSLAHLVFAIPAVRGVEFGTGFAATRMFGSEHNDAILEMGGKNATRSVEEGADTIVWLASEAPQDLTGKFLRDRKEIPW
jgi:chorismate synthase